VAGRKSSKGASGGQKGRLGRAWSSYKSGVLKVRGRMLEVAKEQARYTGASLTDVLNDPEMMATVAAIVAAEVGTGGAATPVSGGALAVASARYAGRRHARMKAKGFEGGSAKRKNGKSPFAVGAVVVADYRVPPFLAGEALHVVRCEKHGRGRDGVWRVLCRSDRGAEGWLDASVLRRKNSRDPNVVDGCFGGVRRNGSKSKARRRSAALDRAMAFRTADYAGWTREDLATLDEKELPRSAGWRRGVKKRMRKAGMTSGTRAGKRRNTAAGPRSNHHLRNGDYVALRGTSQSGQVTATKSPDWYRVLFFDTGENTSSWIDGRKLERISLDVAMRMRKVRKNPSPGRGKVALMHAVFVVETRPEDSAREQRTVAKALGRKDLSHYRDAAGFDVQGIVTDLGIVREYAARMWRV
jgi:hypothetical protein